METLSSKRKTDGIDAVDNYYYVYPEKDVKEFIQKFITDCKCSSCRDLIETKAGEKLS